MLTNHAVEHYWKNVKDGRPSQHAKQYVADHRRAAALDGKSLVKRDRKLLFSPQFPLTSNRIV